MRHWARLAAIFFAAALLVIAMIGMEECATFARLSPDEMLMGAALSAHNRGLLASYKFNLERGAETVRDMIVADGGRAAGVAKLPLRPPGRPTCSAPTAVTRRVARTWLQKPAELAPT